MIGYLWFSIIILFVVLVNFFSIYLIYKAIKKVEKENYFHKNDIFR